MLAVIPFAYGLLFSAVKSERSALVGVYDGRIVGSTSQSACQTVIRYHEVAGK
jgi:hypothetical protein